MSDTLLASKVLDQIVKRLVKGLRPDRIYLFGSQARGQATKSSDFDLLVVVPESTLPRHQREAQSYDLLWGLILHNKNCSFLGISTDFCSAILNMNWIKSIRYLS